MMGEIEVRIEARAAELRKEIAALEATGAPGSEPAIRVLRAQLGELEAPLAGDPDWKARIRERKVREAAGDFLASRRRR